MKRLLTVIGATALAALIAGSILSGGSTSIFAAGRTTQATTLHQNGPGDHGTPPKDDGTHAGGKVTSISDLTITVTGPDDTTKDIVTTSDTTFTLDDESASLSDIAVGQFIMAEGATDDDVFTATSVKASTSQPQAGPGEGRGTGKENDGTHSGGEVTGISDLTITVSGPGDTTKDIVTTSDTTFTLDDESASLSDIAVGQFIMAEGATDDDVFTATSVKASTSQPQHGPGGDGSTPPAKP